MMCGGHATRTWGDDPGETHLRSLLLGLGLVRCGCRHRGLLGRRCRGRGQPLEVLPVQPLEVVVVVLEHLEAEIDPLGLVAELGLLGRQAAHVALGTVGHRPVQPLAPPPLSLPPPVAPPTGFLL